MFGVPAVAVGGILALAGPGVAGHGVARGAVRITVPASPKAVFSRVGWLRSPPFGPTPGSFVAGSDAAVLAGGPYAASTNPGSEAVRAAIYERPSGGWARAIHATGAFDTYNLADQLMVGVTADGDAVAVPETDGVGLWLRPPAAGASPASWLTAPGTSVPPAGARLLRLLVPSGWHPLRWTYPSSRLCPGDACDERVFGHAVAVIVRSDATADGRIVVYERPPTGWPATDQVLSVFLDPPDPGAGGVSGFDWIAARGSTIVARSYVQRSGDPGRSYAIEVFLRPSSGWVTTAVPVATFNEPPNGVVASGATLADLRFLAVADSAVVVGLRDPSLSSLPSTDYGPAAGVTTALVYERAAGGWPSASRPGAVLSLSNAATEVMGESASLTPDGSALLVSGWRRAAGAGGHEKFFDVVFEFDRVAGAWRSGSESQRIDGLTAPAPSPHGLSVDIGTGVAAVGGAADGTVLLARSGHADAGPVPPRPAAAIGEVAVAASADASTVVVRRGVGTYAVIEQGTGWAHPAAAGTIQILPLCGFQGCSRDASAGHVAISPDGREIAFQYDAPDPQFAGEEIYERPAGGWAGTSASAPNVTLRSTGPVAFVGTTVAVGGYPYGSNSPAAFLYVRPGTGWQGPFQLPTATLTMSDHPSWGTYALAGSGDSVFIVAGDPGFGTIGYVWKRPASGWTDATETARFTVPTAAASGLWAFGVPGPYYAPDALAASGDMLVVGAPTYDWASGVERSAALVLVAPNGNWAAVSRPTALLTASDGGLTSRYLATTVATDGATVVLGAYSSPSTQWQPGRSLVYRRPPGGWTSMTESSVLWSDDQVGAYGGCDASTPDISGHVCGWSVVHGTQVILSSPASVLPEWGGTFFLTLPASLAATVMVTPAPVVVRPGKVPAFTASCAVAGHRTTRCVVTLRTSRGVTVATGQASSAAGVATLPVHLVLASAARSALRAAGGHLPVTVDATVTAGTAGTAPAHATATMVSPTVKVTLASDVLFGFDSATLTGAAKSLLARLGKELAGSRSVRCDGFTDNVGSASYNVGLGRRRAAAVCRVLRTYIGRTSIRTFGESHPVASNGTAAGRARNRRVELTVAN